MHVSLSVKLLVTRMNLFCVIYKLELFGNITVSFPAQPRNAPKSVQISLGVFMRHLKNVYPKVHDSILKDKTQM